MPTRPKADLSVTARDHLSRVDMMAMRFDPSPAQTRLVLRAISRMWDGSGGDPVPLHLIYPPAPSTTKRRRAGR